MSIASQITALNSDKTAIAAAITAKGGTLSQNAGFDTFAADIGSIANEEDGVSKLFRKEITNYTASHFKNVVLLPSYTFIDCSNTIQSVSFPDSVKSIAHHCFYNCSMESVNLNHGLETINYSCFNFFKVSELILPATLKNIGASVFLSSTIPTVISLNPVPPTFQGSFGASTEVIYVPAESVNAYKTAANWSTYADRIQAIPQEGNE